MNNGLQPEQGSPRWDEEQLAARVAAAGFNGVLADARYTPDRDRLVTAMHARKVRCGVWHPKVELGSLAAMADGYDCVCGQIEGPGEYANVVGSIAAFRQAHPDMPASVVTNTGGVGTKDLAAPLVEAGFAFITETWVRTDGVPPEARVSYCRNVLGVPDVQPMAGLGENGATMQDYPTLGTFPRSWVFTAETLLQ